MTRGGGTRAEHPRFLDGFWKTSFALAACFLRGGANQGSRRERGRLVPARELADDGGGYLAEGKTDARTRQYAGRASAKCRVGSKWCEHDRSRSALGSTLKVNDRQKPRAQSRKPGRSDAQDSSALGSQQAGRPANPRPGHHFAASGSPLWRWRRHLFNAWRCDGGSSSCSGRVLACQIRRRTSRALASGSQNVNGGRVF